MHSHPSAWLRLQAAVLKASCSWAGSGARGRGGAGSGPRGSRSGSRLCSLLATNTTRCPGH